MILPLRLMLPESEEAQLDDAEMQFCSQNKRGTFDPIKLEY